MRKIDSMVVLNFKKPVLGIMVVVNLSSSNIFAGKIPKSRKGKTQWNKKKI